MNENQNALVPSEDEMPGSTAVASQTPLAFEVVEDEGGASEADGRLKSAVEIVEPTWAHKALDTPAPLPVIQSETGVVDTMLSEAIRNGNIELVERVMALRDKEQAKWAREQYFNALARFQEECPDILKTVTVHDKPEKGGGVRYRYADMGAVVKATKGLLARHGFSWSAKPGVQTGDTITAVVTGHHRDGHEETSEFTAPIDHAAYMSDPQKVASALQFATRRAYLNLWGIATADEDDDANLLTVESGLVYGEYLRVLNEETDLDELRIRGKQYHDELKTKRDHAGAKVILAFYNRRKAELEGGKK